MLQEHSETKLVRTRDLSVTPWEAVIYLYVSAKAIQLEMI